MMLDATTDVSSLRNAGASTGRYHAANGMDYVNFCLQRVVEEYFREEEDGAWNAAGTQLDNLPMACIGKNTGFESLRDQAAASVTQDEELPGEVTELPFGVNAGTWANHYAQWENMRALKLTAKTFEDCLAEWGVSTPEVIERENKPELIRYIREWQYPTNTVEPTTGVPTSALSYSCNVRADKKRFFDEPGFIFGLSVFRPKVYRTNQKSHGSTMLDNYLAWMPAVLQDTPQSSLREFTSAEGPLGDISSPIFTNGYFLDMRDLYSYGDQWVDQETAQSTIAIPTAAQVHKYATETMADTLFSGSGKYIRQDGVVGLSILGTQMDHT